MSNAKNKPSLLPLAGCTYYGIARRWAGHQLQRPQCNIAVIMAQYAQQAPSTSQRKDKKTPHCFIRTIKYTGALLGRLLPKQTQPMTELTPPFTVSPAQPVTVFVLVMHSHLSLCDNLSQIKTNWVNTEWMGSLGLFFLSSWLVVVSLVRGAGV